MPLGTELGLGIGDIVLDGDSVPAPMGHSSPQFSAYVYCGHAAGWIMILLGTEVGLGPGHIMLFWDPALPTEMNTAAPTFVVFGRKACVCINRGPCLLWPSGWMGQDST